MFDIKCYQVRYSFGRTNGISLLNGDVCNVLDMIVNIYMFEFPAFPFTL